MVMREQERDPEIILRTYAMGWFVESYRGRQRVHHGGNIDGFSAMVTFLPAERLGVVALANMDGTPLPEIVCRVAIDRMLGLEPIDWSARLKERADEAEQGAEKAKGGLETYDRKKGTKPAHALDEYAGDYEHPAYGTISVVRDGAGLESLDPRHSDAARALALRDVPRGLRGSRLRRRKDVRALPYQSERRRRRPHDASGDADGRHRLREEAARPPVGSGVS